jgi:hypothetical protein
VSRKRDFGYAWISLWGRILGSDTPDTFLRNGVAVKGAAYNAWLDRFLNQRDRGAKGVQGLVGATGARGQSASAYQVTCSTNTLGLPALYNTVVTNLEYTGISVIPITGRLATTCTLSLPLP